MEYDLKQIGNKTIAILKTTDEKIEQTEDILDLLMNCRFSGADSLIIYENQLSQEFFDLKTKLAGDILQKFSTYDFRLAIICDFDNKESSSLKAFIAESNRTGRINFVSSEEEALGKLS
ncbi:DUF4180 domain-containing protein [Jiulongibacter sp. NS-SX5]|uniref:DUF4180 domain-containing protein n=1 Tax=Jiulongibacter sp. NS-SX5 TaxID=3463854 RepID=UPI004059FA1D